MKSLYSDFHAFVVRPETAGAVVTIEDQKRLGVLFPKKRAKFIVLEFPTEGRGRAEVINHLKRVALSKPMLITEVTDKQISRRYKDGETIAGTGIKATAMQLRETLRF